MILEYINIWAVLTASVAGMLIGALWYGPLFGKLFMRESGMDKWPKKRQQEETKKMKRTFLLQFFAFIATFALLAWLLGALGKGSLAGSIILSLVVWAGFIVPIKLGEQIWGGKMSLFWLGADNQLITMLVTGVIIGVWR